MPYSHWQLMERNAHLDFLSKPTTKAEVTKFEEWVAEKFVMKPDEVQGISGLLLASWEQFDGLEPVLNFRDDPAVQLVWQGSRTRAT